MISLIGLQEVSAQGVLGQRTITITTTELVATVTVTTVKVAVTTVKLHKA